MSILPLSDPGSPPWPDLLQAAPILILYKDSLFCISSLFSGFSIRAFSSANPDLPIFQVDVIGQRDLSSRIAQDLQILHQSPQAIMVAEGRPVWAASHGGITARALEQALANAKTAKGATRPSAQADR